MLKMNFEELFYSYNRVVLYYIDLFNQENI